MMELIWDMKHVTGIMRMEFNWTKKYANGIMTMEFTWNIKMKDTLMEFAWAKLSLASILFVTTENVKQIKKYDNGKVPTKKKMDIQQL